ncbi:MAG TPA: hypothetical protein VEA41_10070 [Salinarimonas sp.]|nr:hypothetical protein [Salinarimonas sp.]
MRFAIKSGWNESGMSDPCFSGFHPQPLRIERMTTHHSGPMGFVGWPTDSRLPHSSLTDHDEALRNAAEAFGGHHAGRTNQYPDRAALWSAIKAYLEYKPGRTLDPPPWLVRALDLTTAISDTLPKDHPLRARADALDGLLLPLIPVSRFTDACRARLSSRAADESNARTAANEAWDRRREAMFDASEARKAEKP